MENENQIMLYKLFARMLYDIGRGYGAKETIDFIDYVLKLNESIDIKLEIVKTALQLAIVWKELNEGNPDKVKTKEIFDKLIENAFSNISANKKIDIEKIKNFIEKLATHRNISNSKLRGVYLESIS